MQGIAYTKRSLTIEQQEKGRSRSCGDTEKLRSRNKDTPRRWEEPAERETCYFGSAGGNGARRRKRTA